MNNDLLYVSDTLEDCKAIVNVSISALEGDVDLQSLGVVLDLIVLKIEDVEKVIEDMANKDEKA